MNSQRFIEQNREKWLTLEQLLDKIEKKGIASLNRDELQSLGPLFRRVTADLSYAQTNFAGSEVIVYLNRLVARAHSQLYRTETASLRRLMDFYVNGLPRLIFQYRKYIIAAAIILAAGIGWGWALNHYQNDLTAAVVPAEVRESVEQSVQNNEVGRNLTGTEKPMFSGFIMTNNIRVSLLSLVLGVTWGTGTVFILIYNGVMLGVLANIFAAHQQSLVFWSLILPHGILELFAIVLNGGAGLLIASALVRPGDYKRKDALMVKGKPAVLMAVGSIPILVTAGVIEGFITPLKVLPWIKLGFAWLTALALFFYIFHGARAKYPGTRETAGEG